MAGIHDEARGGVKHPAFHQGFVWAVLVFALVLGFPIEAHLTSILGLGFPVGKSFASLVQTHGHVQLVGWVGFMIIGISLYFVPRLAGVPVRGADWQHRILWLMGMGLTLRSIGHPVLAYVEERPLFIPITWLVAVSGGLEWPRRLSA